MNRAKTSLEKIEGIIVDWLGSDDENATNLANELLTERNNFALDYSLWLSVNAVGSNSKDGWWYISGSWKTNEEAFEIYRLSLIK